MDGRQPEGLPGGLLEVAADLLARQGEELPLVLPLPRRDLVGRRGRLFLQPALDGGIARARPVSRVK